MKPTRLANYIAALCLSASLLHAEDLTIPEGGKPMVVFTGREDTILVPFQNESEKSADIAVSLRLYQLTSSSAVPMGVATPWKTVTVPAGKTLLETATVNLPDVRALTVFRATFLSNDSEIGRISILGLPAGSIRELLKGEAVGVFGGDGELGQFLTTEGVTTVSADDTNSKVVIAGPFFKDSTVPSDLNSRVQEWNARGASVILLLPHRYFAKSDAAGLDFLTGVVRTKSGTVATADASNLTNLKQAAAAQLALHQLLSLALERETFPWFTKIPQ